MAISLVKGQKISLEKESGGGLSKVVMGLGWDPAQKKKGFFSFLFSQKTEIDLDASCVLFDENKKFVDVVFFGNLKTKDGTVVHTGDNLTGEGEGDDEQIIVWLDKVAPSVKDIIFAITSYQGQTFNAIDNAFCRIVDARNNKELARYTLTGGGAYTAMIMAKIYRHQGEWKMSAIGEPAQGKTILDLAPNILRLL
ncbi:MAG: TerD family protein [Deltaproteobacteria bacterium]|jgi:tellurium resistance protein TerZ|nr:TerD family protein [Deltaproteobacteria bacterium]